MVSFLESGDDKAGDKDEGLGMDKGLTVDEDEGLGMDKGLTVDEDEGLGMGKGLTVDEDEGLGMERDAVVTGLTDALGKGRDAVVTGLTDALGRGRDVGGLTVLLGEDAVVKGLTDPLGIDANLAGEADGSNDDLLTAADGDTFLEGDDGSNDLLTDGENFNEEADGCLLDDPLIGDNLPEGAGGTDPLDDKRIDPRGNELNDFSLGEALIIREAILLYRDLRVREALSPARCLFLLTHLLFLLFITCPLGHLDGVFDLLRLR